MSDTKELARQLLHEAYHTDYKLSKPWDLLVAAADTIARLEAERDAARREAMGECARIVDEKAEAYWAEWDANADPSSQGSAAACEALLAAIREAMEKP